MIQDNDMHEYDNQLLLVGRMQMLSNMFCFLSTRKSSQG